MLFFTLFSALILSVSTNRTKMEPFVVGGRETKIHEYPHSVYLNILCRDTFICGGSILNQKIILTAAHCLEDCTVKKKPDVYVKYGHELLNSMRSTEMAAYVNHEGYNDHTMANDIALVLVKEPIKLGRTVQRVALVTSLPHNVKLAYMAGWGVMDAQDHLSLQLLDAVQELQPPKVCKMIGELPKGSFCAGPISGPGAPDKGDSGSALIVQKFIQIGLVSFKVKQFSLVVYTNVSYHYRWIRKNAKGMLCNKLQ